MAAPIVGRDNELAHIRALVADAEPPMRALVLDGEAGIGKTTLWRTAVREARARQLTVLTAQPSRPEAALPYAALGDLLEPLLGERLERVQKVLSAGGVAKADNEGWSLNGVPPAATVRPPTRLKQATTVAVGCDPLPESFRGIGGGRQ